MNEIAVFKNEQFGTIRTLSVEGEPWFVAADVCRALDIKNSRDAIARLDDDEKGVALTDTLGWCLDQESQKQNNSNDGLLMMSFRQFGRPARTQSNQCLSSKSSDTAWTN